MYDTWHIRRSLNVIFKNIDISLKFKGVYHYQVKKCINTYSEICLKTNDVFDTFVDYLLASLSDPLANER